MGTHTQGTNPQQGPSTNEMLEQLVGRNAGSQRAFRFLLAKDILLGKLAGVDMLPRDPVKAADEAFELAEAMIARGSK